jgi:hypothetical protein
MGCSVSQERRSGKFEALAQERNCGFCWRRVGAYSTLNAPIRADRFGQKNSGWRCEHQNNQILCQSRGPPPQRWSGLSEFLFLPRKIFVVRDGIFKQANVEKSATGFRLILVWQLFVFVCKACLIGATVKAGIGRL